MPAKEKLDAQASDNQGIGQGATIENMRECRKSPKRDGRDGATKDLLNWQDKHT